MGNCGNPSSQQVLDRPGGGILMIWGDYFSSETRTILVMLRMCDVKHEAKIIDQFLGEHKKQEYLNINPTGQIPMLTEGKFLVLGGYQVHLNFLCNNNKSIRDKLFPQDYKQDIDKHMNWF